MQKLSRFFSLSRQSETPNLSTGSQDQELTKIGTANIPTSLTLKSIMDPDRLSPVDLLKNVNQLSNLGILPALTPTSANESHRQPVVNRTIKYDNGDLYHGELENDCANGYGEMFFGTGDFYRGAWKDDEIDGKGEYRWVDGAEYVGDFIQYNKDGQGKMTFPVGCPYKTYEGGWKNNKLEGQGTLIFIDGSKYTGSFANDKMSGTGEFWYANGDHYKGQFQDHVRNGPGILTLANNEKYACVYEDGKAISIEMIDETNIINH